MGSGGEGRVREWRYAGHILIQIYFRMHHFVAKFSQFSSPQAARGHIDPLTKILRTPLPVPIRRRCVSGMRDVVA